MITFGYSDDLQIDSCDVAWTAGSNVTSTIETTDKKQGTGAVKLTVAAGATAGQVLGRRNVPLPLDISDCTGVKLWVKSSVNLDSGDLQLRLNDIESDITTTPEESMNFPAITADTWTSLTLTPAAASALISVACIGVYQVNDKGAFVLLIDDIVAVLPDLTLDTLYVKGIDSPERVVFPNALVQDDLSGGVTTSASTFRRAPLVHLQVIQAKADQVALFRWIFRKDIQQVTYNSEDVNVIMRRVDGYELHWIENVDFAKALVLELEEKDARRTVPASWLT